MCGGWWLILLLHIHKSPPQQAKAAALEGQVRELRGKLQAEVAQTQAQGQEQVTAMANFTKALESQLQEERAFRDLLEERYRTLETRAAATRQAIAAASPRGHAHTTTSSSSSTLMGKLLSPSHTQQQAKQSAPSGAGGSPVRAGARS